MEFEKYDSEVHDQRVMDWFSSLAKKPSKFAEYREAIQEALQEVDEAVGVDADFKVVVAETQEVEGSDLPEWKYVLGMSLSPEYHWVEENTLFVRTTDSYENWRSAVKHTVAHEEAHQEFYENRDLGSTVYDHMLFEGHAQKTAEKVSEENGYNWDIVNLTDPDVMADNLKQELEKDRAWNEEQSEEISTLFNPGGSKWQNAEGYAVTYQVVTEIMGRNNYDVRDLLRVEDEKWRGEVDKSIERLYD